MPCFLVGVYKFHTLLLVYVRLFFLFVYNVLPFYFFFGGGRGLVGDVIIIGPA